MLVGYLNIIFREISTQVFSHLKKFIFIFIFFNFYFIYFWLLWVFVAARGLPIVVASLVAEHRL